MTEETYLEEQKVEYRFYTILVSWIGAIILAIIVCTTIYNVTDRIGPVKPYMHQEYSWPNGTPSK